MDVVEKAKDALTEAVGAKTDQVKTLKKELANLTNRALEAEADSTRLTKQVADLTAQATGAHTMEQSLRKEMLALQAQNQSLKGEVRAAQQESERSREAELALNDQLESERVQRISADHSPTRTSTPRRGRSPTTSRRDARNDRDDRNDHDMDFDAPGGEDEESQLRPEISRPSVSSTSQPGPSASQTSTVGSEVVQSTDDMEQAMSTYRELTSEDEQTVSLELGRTQLQSIAEAGVSLMNLIQQAAKSESQEWRRYSPKASFQPRGRGQRGRHRPYLTTKRPTIRRNKTDTRRRGSSHDAGEYPASRFGASDFGAAIQDLTKIRHVSGMGSLSVTASSSQSRPPVTNEGGSRSSTPSDPQHQRSRREDSTHKARSSQGNTSVPTSPARSRTPSEKKDKKTDKDKKSGKKS